MNERIESWRKEDLIWCDLRDATETIVAKAGIHRGLIHHGAPIYADGYATSWITPWLEIDGKQGLSPTPLVVVEIPDYRRPDAVSLLFDPDSARAIAAELIRLANESERTLSKQAKRQIQTMKAPAEEQARKSGLIAATRCSVERCNRERRYFNEAGQGFCKRHAEELGIRPKGKVI